MNPKNKGVKWVMRIREQGQSLVVTVPADLCSKWGLEAGDHVVMTPMHYGALFYPLREDPAFLAGAGKE